MSSRRLEDLHPLVGERANRLVDLAETNGIKLLVTSTLSACEESKPSCLQ